MAAAKKPGASTRRRQLTGARQLITLAAMLLLTTVPALAQSSGGVVSASPVPGGTYLGRHAGGADFSLSVTADGADVSTFSASDIPCAEGWTVSIERRSGERQFWTNLNAGMLRFVEPAGLPPA